MVKSNVFLDRCVCLWFFDYNIVNWINKREREIIVS